jgi:hypothetical protein
MQVQWMGTARTRFLQQPDQPGRVTAVSDPKRVHHVKRKVVRSDDTGAMKDPLDPND